MVHAIAVGGAMTQCPLSDEQIDAIAERQIDWVNDGTSEVSLRRFARAIEAAAVEAERRGREGEDFENSLEAHHRAELGLRPKLPEGHHYFHRILNQVVKVNHLLDVLFLHSHLWDQNRLRTTFENSPHAQ